MDCSGPAALISRARFPDPLILSSEVTPQALAIDRRSGRAACGARTVAFTCGEFEVYCFMENCTAAVVPPEVTLKLSEFMSVGVKAMFNALTSTGLAISLPEIW